MPRVDEYASTSGLDSDDTALWVVDGALKNVPSAAARGYIDASHYSDVNEQVINDCETITGFTTSLATQDGGVIQLDSAVFTTGANSVKALIYMNREPFASSFYWNSPSDVAVGTHAEVAFALRTEALDNAETMMRAFVASGVNLTGTIVYADDFTLQFPNDADHYNLWYTIRIPLTGITNIRSVGITQHSIPAGSTSDRSWFYFDNMVLREGTGIDRAVYGAPANSHIVIPATYTSAKTQLPIHREAAGVTWEDRRS